MRWVKVEAVGDRAFLIDEVVPLGSAQARQTIEKVRS